MMVSCEDYTNVIEELKYPLIDIGDITTKAPLILNYLNKLVMQNSGKDLMVLFTYDKQNQIFGSINFDFEILTSILKILGSFKYFKDADNSIDVATIQQLVGWL